MADNRLLAVGAARVACMTLLHACAQRPALSPNNRTPPPGLIVNHAWNEPGPIVVLDGKLLLGATYQDLVLRELDGATIDSIRVFPADSTTKSLFGSLAADGVVTIATRQRP